MSGEETGISSSSLSVLEYVCYRHSFLFIFFIEHQLEDQNQRRGIPSPAFNRSQISARHRPFDNRTPSNQFPLRLTPIPPTHLWWFRPALHRQMHSPCQSFLNPSKRYSTPHDLSRPRTQPRHARISRRRRPNSDYTPRKFRRKYTLVRLPSYKHYISCVVGIPSGTGIDGMW